MIVYIQGNRRDYCYIVKYKGLEKEELYRVKFQINYFRVRNIQIFKFCKLIHGPYISPLVTSYKIQLIYTYITIYK